MLKKLFISTVSNTIVHHQHPWRTIANRSLSSASSTINSIVLRSLKEHYLEVAKMVQPPKVDPPSLFSVVKGSLDDASHGPVLRRSYGDEEISIAVTRLANVGEDHDDDQGDDINQLFLHVDVSKPGRDDSLQFLCGLYPDAIGIHAVSMRPKVEGLQCLVDSKKYSGPAFQ
ncbi:hypothetical protein GIB67_034378 [Kingdonia uniflora]|uniref:Uncharacterized protein n=1 Tax=Kingdonia uniflora TaxID=39325 RepID=A0A7J7NS26_9MAGN|nr:hypothetical protein GIB67_034378 [Kingdonia uniflora]